MLRRSMLFASMALIALAAAGCGGDGGYRFPVHPAAGKVMRGGKPVPKAIVRFHPTDPATVKIPDGQEGPPVVLTTETDEDGAFVMSTYLADDGIPAGDYVVTVQIGLDAPDVENADVMPNRNLPLVAKLYRKPDTSPLKATVKPGDNQFVFECDQPDPKVPTPASSIE